MKELRHNGDLSGVQGELTVLARRQSPYQWIEIVQHPVYGAQLILDGDLQISESDFAYNTALAAPVMTLARRDHVAILGGGDGGVLNELLRAGERTGKPVDRITMVDIDADVMTLCEDLMPTFCGSAFRHPRAEVIAGDALSWLEQAENLDAVIYDLTMDPVRDDMTRSQFIRYWLNAVHRALRPDGVVSLQACGENEPERESLLGELRTVLDDQFQDRREQEVMVPSYGEHWTFMAAWK
jgi:spermidine synthase/spermine synthase